MEFFVLLVSCGKAKKGGTPNRSAAKAVCAAGGYFNNVRVTGKVTS